uniref:Uncharacterized protein n=1 Tax=Oryza rufipogon TaxID=4529 RepID=A0A0E0QWM7_ORYRU
MAIGHSRCRGVGFPVAKKPSNAAAAPSHPLAAATRYPRRLIGCALGRNPHLQVRRNQWLLDSIIFFIPQLLRLYT